jgi:hypothetical protein
VNDESLLEKMTVNIYRMVADEGRREHGLCWALNREHVVCAAQGGRLGPGML